MIGWTGPLKELACGALLGGRVFLSRRRFTLAFALFGGESPSDDGVGIFFGETFVLCVFSKLECRFHVSHAAFFRGFGSTEKLALEIFGLVPVA